MGCASACWEGAATGGISGRAVAEGRVAVALGYKVVDGRVCLEDDRRSSGSEVVAVLNPVFGNVGLDRYLNGCELGCHHDGRHESHFLLGSGDTDRLGVITGLSVGAHDLSIAAPSDGLTAVTGAFVGVRVCATGAFPGPLRVLCISNTGVHVA